MGQVGLFIVNLLATSKFTRHEWKKKRKREGRSSSTVTILLEDQQATDRKIGVNRLGRRSSGQLPAPSIIQRLNATSSSSSLLFSQRTKVWMACLSLLFHNVWPVFSSFHASGNKRNSGELKSCNREVVNWNRRKGKRVARSMKSLLRLRNLRRVAFASRELKKKKKNLNSSR